MTTKIRCGAIMVLAKLKPHRTTLHRTCNRKNKMRCSYGFR